MEVEFEVKHNNKYLFIKAKAKKVTPYGANGLSLSITDEDDREILEETLDETTLEDIKEQAYEALYEAQYEV